MLKDLSITIAQINPTVGDIDGNVALVGEVLDRHRDTNLIVFPELVVSGYPPEDLILHPAFVQDCMRAAQECAQKYKTSTAFVLTTPWRDEDSDKLYNAALFIQGGIITHKIFKHALPNYGVFDEQRTFDAGPLPDIVAFKGHKLGILVCEDAWFPQGAAHLKQQGAELLIVSNGSPYTTDKAATRLSQTRARVQETGLPLLYVNQVGGQDELVFDGASFALDANGEVVFQAPAFESYCGCVDNNVVESAKDKEREIYQALVLGLRDYITKNNFPGVIIGMSGGIDSALSAAIAADALGADKVRCVMMPSPFTTQESFEDARACAQELGVSYEEVPVAAAMTAFENSIPGLNGLAHENMQARARGVILMSLSNQSGSMVLTTGNKSEMAVGYATLYGDMCGGFNVLKDVYKTCVYALARWRNTQSKVIPARIITKAPTAELRANQTDQDSLPPYEILDGILEGLVERRESASALIEAGYERETVQKVRRLLDLAEYKRSQAAPGVKITSLAFGRDRRMPITNGYRFTVEKP